MGKITKTMQAKHKETLSPWLKGYVESASSIPLPLLPKQLADFPSRWPFGRGDLYHWIPLLNRFDSILEKFCTIYELDIGPQPRDFGCDLLSNHSDDPQLRVGDAPSSELPSDYRIPPNGDRLLIESILKFTRMLLEHCGNRSIYASSGHLNNLLNSTSWSILIAALEVGSELAQRYQASVRRIGSASRQFSSALLANHYNIDLDRVQQLALPFIKTPIVSLAAPLPSSTPTSATRGKDRVAGGTGKATASMHANDLVAIASSDDKRWAGWGDVKVSYYPQEVASSSTYRPEAGRSSVPSTPTPLRRSSTMNSHSHNTPKARNTSGDESSPLGPKTPAVAEDPIISGQKIFDLPYSLVSSASIHDLVSRCPADMPPAARYEVFHRLRVVKALTDSHQARQLVLAARLLAITNLAYIHTESTFIEKVLRQDVDETRRFHLVYQLAELIHPSTDANVEIPIWLQTIALALLEAISGFNAKCQDVLSALNANVSHGVLLYVIRKAVAGMKEDEDSDDGDKATEHDEWRNNLFSLTLHLSMHTRVGPEMVSAGLMEILVEMLKIRSNVAQRHHSMVLAFLDGLIWTYQNAFTAFFSANGLDAVAELVVDTVREAKLLMESGQGTTPEQQSNAVDYKIPYYQQQTLRWLLKFVHHIMSNSYSYSGNTDRLLRNLADKSDLLASLRQVMEDKQSFGSVDWTNCVTILSDFINNDPTSFAAISESGMVKTYLEAITGRPVGDDISMENQQVNDDEEPESPGSSAIVSTIEADDRPHPPPESALREEKREPLAAGILPSSDAINVVPQVLNSISLNNTGMKMVVSSRAFDSFFEIFENPEHVKCMESDTDLAGNVGGSFDELARHHPSLRTPITNAVIDMVARIRFLGQEKARVSGWGARLWLTEPSGKIVSVAEDGSFREAHDLQAKGKNPLSAGDPDIDMSDSAALRDVAADKAIESRKESPEESFTPYIYAVASFLTSYLSNAMLKTSFTQQGGVEILLDICESPSLSANFGDSLASRVLAQVVSQLVDSSAILVLPSLLNRAQAAIDNLEPIASKTSPLPAYFAPYLATDSSTASSSPSISNGTKLIKSFLNAQTFIKIISECFPTSRLNVLNFYPVNVYDHYLRLIKSIGPLLRGVLAEEAGQLTMVPQSWTWRRSSPLIDTTSDGKGAVPEGDTPALPAVPGDDDAWGQSKAAEASGSSRPTEQEQSSPRFQNYEVFHHLLHPMIPTTFPLFQSLGKALLPRREQNQGDPFPRPRQLEIAKALADTVLLHLRPSVAGADPTSKDFHYWIIMLHTIHEMLIDHPPPRHSDRSHVQLIMPVLLAFKEEGGFDVLNDMLKMFAETVRLGSQFGPEESSRPKVAAFGLKKILDLYFVLANGKYINDANSFVNLQRQTDRSQTVPNVFGQIVVEIRALILPAIAALWETSFVEKVPDPTAKRLVDVLKLIATGDNEPTSTPKDKVRVPP
jgi:E3 ubiquitin-protein ligase HUWE1